MGGCHSTSTTTYMTSTLLRLDACDGNDGDGGCLRDTGRVLRTLNDAGCHTRLNGGTGFVLVRDMNTMPRGSRVSIPLACTSCCFVRTLRHCGQVLSKGDPLWVGKGGVGEGGCLVYLLATVVLLPVKMRTGSGGGKGGGVPVARVRAANARSHTV